MSKIIELNEELQGVKNQMEFLAQTNVPKSNESYQALENREAELLQLIMEEESKAVVETTIEGVVQDISTGLESFEVGDTVFTLDDLAVDEDAAEILRKGIKTISKFQANKFLEELSTQKSVHEYQINTRQALVDSLIADRDALQSANTQLQLEKDDLSEKRDAAAQQLLEAQAEIARLNSHVDDLRIEIANGSANAHNVIDITSDAELEAAAQRLKAKKEQAAAEKKAAEEAARVRIYGVEQLDGTGAQFGAYKAENDEYITFGWLERNKYVELSDEEAARFRAELEAAKQSELESVPEVAEELDFREPLPVPEIQNADTDSGLGGDETVPESDENMVGDESFEQEVRRRLCKVEALINIYISDLEEGAAA
jgi:hypothetical protein